MMKRTYHFLMALKERLFREDMERSQEQGFPEGIDSGC